MKDFSTFETNIDFTFKNKALLKQALTHRSYINEHSNEAVKHNERFEFLGDAVLELVATEFLFNKFPDKPEGELTAFRAALVNTVSLSYSAHKVGANDFLLLSKGEARDTGKARDFILANTFEAIIGAVYLDQGYEAAKKFIQKHLLYRIDEIVSNRLWQDAKSKFQEEAQEHDGITPSYNILRETGPDHDKKFTTGVYLNSELVAEGSGSSKQEAEQDAAANALKAKNW